MLTIPNVLSKVHDAKSSKWLSHLQLAQVLLCYDNSAFSRKEASDHLLASINQLEQDAPEFFSSDLLSSREVLINSPAPNATDLDAILQKLLEVKFFFIWGFLLPGFLRSTLARTIRDFGVISLTLLVLFVLYRQYNGYPVNIWSNNYATMGVMISKSRQDYGKLELDKTVGKLPIFVDKVYYPKALGTHANGEIDLVLERKSKYFSGACAYPDSASSANIQCAISTDKGEIWRSETLNQDKRLARFRIETLGVTHYRFAVTTMKKGDITAAHAAWIDFKLTEE